MNPISRIIRRGRLRAYFYAHLPPLHPHAFVASGAHPTTSRVEVGMQPWAQARQSLSSAHCRGWHSDLALEELLLAHMQLNLGSPQSPPPAYEAATHLVPQARQSASDWHWSTTQ